MKVGAAARNLVGFLPEHAAAFQSVAQQNNCIIMSRAPGIFVPGLVSLGYASKGFHNKAKSCNWGPMAGFVNMVARFSKAGLTDKGVRKQTSYIQNALIHGATPVQIFIPDARLTWLTQQGYVKRYNPGNKYGGKKGQRVWRFKATMKGCQGDYVEKAKAYIFTLKEKSIGDELLWALYYQEKDTKPIKPVKALKDPNWQNINVELDNQGMQRQKFGGPAPLGMPQYKKATTGDHDLFAVWGPANVNPNLYARPVGPDDLNSPIDLDLKEDPEQGNISQYIAGIVQMLNQEMRRVRWGSARFAYDGGDMVHHSDEAGRPFMDDVDLPFIAFFPRRMCDIPNAVGATTVAFETLGDFRTLIDRAAKWQRHIELNPGWIKDLAGGDQARKQRYEQYVIQGKQYQGII